MNDFFGDEESLLITSPWSSGYWLKGTADIIDGFGFEKLTGHRYHILKTNPVDQILAPCEDGIQRDFQQVLVKSINVGL